MTARSKPLLIITGPTGSGKSSLAVRIAQHLPVEIINADSVQLYKGFRILAGQPSDAQKAVCPHHLFEVLDPQHRSDVAEYLSLADPLIDEIQNRGKVVVVVGGTGMYIRALLHGLVELPEIPAHYENEARKQLAEIKSQACSAEEYQAAVRDLLIAEDPLMAEKLHPSDTQRIVRALAVKKATGQSLQSLQQSHAYTTQRYSALVVHLAPPREQLYNQINQRVDEMLTAGGQQEVAELVRRYGPDCHALQSIGYKHMLESLTGALEYAQAVELMKRDTRRFAKRQLTWWRNQPKKLGWQGEAQAAEKFNLSCLLREFERLCALAAGGADSFVAWYPCESVQ